MKLYYINSQKEKKIASCNSNLKLVNDLNIAYFKPENDQCKLHVTKLNNSLKGPEDIHDFGSSAVPLSHYVKFISEGP